MLFNSFEFALFLPIVFLLYWFVFGYALSKNKRKFTGMYIAAMGYRRHCRGVEFRGGNPRRVTAFFVFFITKIRHFVPT